MLIQEGDIQSFSWSAALFAYEYCSYRHTALHDESHSGRPGAAYLKLPLRSVVCSEYRSGPCLSAQPQAMCL